MKRRREADVKEPPQPSKMALYHGAPHPHALHALLAIPPHAYPYITFWRLAFFLHLQRP